MLSLTRKADYALIALLHLARCEPQHLSARALAERFRLPVAALMNVLKALSRAGIVTSERGSQGGYRLSLPAAEITVGRVVHAVEGASALVPCLMPQATAQGLCSRMGDCPLQAPIRRLHAQVTDLLERWSLADLLRQDHPAQHAAMSVPATSVSAMSVSAMTELGTASASLPGAVDAAGRATLPVLRTTASGCVCHA